MPSFDTSLKYALMRAGMPAGIATEISTLVPSIGMSSIGGIVSLTAGGLVVNQLSVTSFVTLSPSNQNITIAPTGTGTATFAPATLGTINNMSIGQTTPAAVKATNLQAGTFTDISGTPGNGTSSGLRGRAAFAAAGSAVTVTSALVTATSSVFVQLAGADATLTSVRVTPGAGSFVVTGNAAATGITPFDFFVVN